MWDSGVLDREVTRHETGRPGTVGTVAGFILPQVSSSAASSAHLCPEANVLSVRACGKVAGKGDQGEEQTGREDEPLLETAAPRVLVPGDGFAGKRGALPAGRQR